MWVLKTTIMCALVLSFLSPAFAKIKELERKGRGSDQIYQEVVVLCIDGQKFIYVYGRGGVSSGAGAGAGAGVSLVQVYEEKDGRTVPATCE